MKNKVDMVFGECIHGRNMASCFECHPLKVDPIKALEEMKKSVVAQKEAISIIAEHERTIKLNDIYAKIPNRQLVEIAKSCALVQVEGMIKASKRITNHLPKSWCGKEQEHYKELKEHIHNYN